jgi:hypothetical protein
MSWSSSHSVRWTDGALVQCVDALTGSLGSTTIYAPVSDRMIRRLRRGNHQFILSTQNVHLAPNTQQAEQAGFTHAKNHETCQSIFSWKLTKGKAVRYQSLELAEWYQTFPYLRPQSQIGMTHSYRKLFANKLKAIRELIKGKITLPNGCRKHDSNRSLFE